MPTCSLKMRFNRTERKNNFATLVDFIPTYLFCCKTAKTLAKLPVNKACLSKHKPGKTSLQIMP